LTVEIKGQLSTKLNVKTQAVPTTWGG